MLVVDDEAILLDLWCPHMEIIGVPVCGTASSADAAIAMAIEHRPAVVLMDVRLRGDKDGVDAALVIRETVGSEVVFVTGSKDPEAMARMRLAHPAAVLFKPASDRQLYAAVRDAMESSSRLELKVAEQLP